MGYLTLRNVVKSYDGRTNAVDDITIEISSDNRFTDSESGEATYAVSYIVDGFIFGAPGAEKREEFARASQPTAEPKRRKA